MSTKRLNVVFGRDWQTVLLISKICRLFASELGRDYRTPESNNKVVYTGLAQNKSENLKNLP